MVVVTPVRSRDKLESELFPFGFNSPPVEFKTNSDLYDSALRLSHETATPALPDATLNAGQRV